MCIRLHLFVAVVDGKDYFNTVKFLSEFGHPFYALDSIESNLNGTIPHLEEIDLKRRAGRTDEKISHARARTVESIYNSSVEVQRMEGLIFKDLTSPYVLGENSRELRYWHKFKPDYFGGGAASDLDLVIIGGYWASGLKLAGKPSAFLCSCVDAGRVE
jgi:ATP-dependent DNA ligase